MAYLLACSVTTCLLIEPKSSGSAEPTLIARADLCDPLGQLTQGDVMLSTSTRAIDQIQRP
jgi:hypothetical protein